MNDIINKPNDGVEGTLELKPTKNTEFDTEQEAYDFYKKYGRIMGFSIRRESSGKNKKTSDLTSRILTSTKEGFRAVDKGNDMIKRSRAKTRIGCGVHMGVRLDRHRGKFYVYTFVEQHNHLLVKALIITSVIFGVTLMYDETAASFGWLFKTFLKAMFSKALRTILIDQNHAMAKAILEVMPNIYHRLCLWHLWQNACKNVNTLFRCEEGVHNALTKKFDHIDEESEFVAAWYSMLDV